MPDRLALYARTSTADQHCEVQLHELRAYAERRGGEVVEFVDAGQSGAKDSRPALNAMLAEVRRRRLTAVVVVKLDRLGRSLKHLLDVLGELERLGVAFVSLDDGVDTNTAAGRMFL